MGLHQPHIAAGMSTGNMTYMPTVVACSIVWPTPMSPTVTPANRPPPMNTMTARAAICRQVRPNIGLGS